MYKNRQKMPFLSDTFFLSRRSMAIFNNTWLRFMLNQNCIVFCMVLRWKWHMTFRWFSHFHRFVWWILAQGAVTKFATVSFVMSKSSPILYFFMLTMKHFIHVLYTKLFRRTSRMNHTSKWYPSNKSIRFITRKRSPYPWRLQLVKKLHGFSKKTWTLHFLSKLLENLID